MNTGTVLDTLDIDAAMESEVDLRVMPSGYRVLSFQDCTMGDARFDISEFDLRRVLEWARSKGWDVVPR